VKSIPILMILLLASCTPLTASPSIETPSATPAISEQAPSLEPGEVRTLTVMTHDSFAVSEEVITTFESQAGVKVRVLSSGDAGTMLNKAILSKGNPLADVLYGFDNTFLSRALQAEIFEPYDAPILAEIPEQYQMDSSHQALPVDYADVCLNVDLAAFSHDNLEPPQTLSDLLKPEYKDLLVVENPTTSSPGLAFLLTTISTFAEPGYLDFWKGLVENNVRIVNDWNTAYYTEFSLWGGTRPIVVSYNSSPPFEFIFAETPLESPPSAAITSPGTCFRQVEFVGILKGTSQRDLAEKWIDFMLSPSFQEDMPLQMAVFPVIPQANLEEAFTRFLVIPETPASLASDLIAQNRESWIKAWTEVVLH
jgi:thiamine transport system substrate-binding protein